MDRPLWWFLIAGLAVALVVAGIVSGFASGEPDGLERVSIDEGFADSADDHALEDSPLADYAIEGIENERLSTGVAGVIGVLVTLAFTTALLYGVRHWGRRRRAHSE